MIRCPPPAFNQARPSAINVDRPELAHQRKLVYLHGSSNHPEDGKWIVTHIAVVEAGEIPESEWPAAIDTDKLLERFGRPYPHGATEAPVPRDVDEAI